MVQQKKITVLNFDLSDNSLGRAYIISKALSNDFNVQIAGPAIKGDIWEPLRNCDIDIKITKYARFPFLIFKLPAILKEIDGDIIYAIKPRFTSFGTGLIKKLVSGKPLILDVDDWEVGFYLRKGFWSRLSKFLNLSNPNGFFWTWVLQFFMRYADKQTTVSSFLQKKYGGIIIPHVKDTGFYDPENFNKETVKREQGLSGKKLIMFFGTPREHKGIEDLITAIKMIKDDSVVLTVVGCTLNGAYENRLKKLGGERIKLIYKVPMNKLPYYLSMADIVAVPQRETPDTIGQMPSKIFDAMAMAKPIISTKVSDIPLILDDCGVLVEPGDTEALREKIEWLLNNIEQAELLGKKARQRCMENYSMTVARQSLKDLIGEIIEKEN